MERKVIIGVLVLAVAIVGAVAALNYGVTGNATSSPGPYYCCGLSTTNMKITASTSTCSKVQWLWGSKGVAEACWKTTCLSYCNSIGYGSGRISSDKKSCTCSSPRNCTDTDGGKTYNVRGTVTEAAGVGSGPYTDICASSTSLTEYYCDAANVARLETVTCPYGATCYSGLCSLYAPMEPNNCTDSDGGTDYLVKGNKVNSSGSFEDYCEDSTHLMEYNCSNSGHSSNWGALDCNTLHKFCLNGACVVSSGTENCTDTDGGYPMYDIAGTVTNSSGTFTDTCFGNIVHEYGCQDAMAAAGYPTSEIDCTRVGKRCSGGACVANATANCTDTDAFDPRWFGVPGNNTFVAGTCTDSSGRSYTDSCLYGISPSGEGGMYRYYVNETYCIGGECEYSEGYPFYNMEDPCTTSCTAGACV